MTACEERTHSCKSGFKGLVLFWFSAPDSPGICVKYASFFPDTHYIFWNAVPNTQDVILVQHKVTAFSRSDCPSVELKFWWHGWLFVSQWCLFFWKTFILSLVQMRQNNLCPLVSINSNELQITFSRIIAWQLVCVLCKVLSIFSIQAL